MFMGFESEYVVRSSSEGGVRSSLIPGLLIVLGTIGVIAGSHAFRPHNIPAPLTKRGRSVFDCDRVGISGPDSFGIPCVWFGAGFLVTNTLRQSRFRSPFVPTRTGANQMVVPAASSAATQTTTPISHGTPRCQGPGKDLVEYRGEERVGRSPGVTTTSICRSSSSSLWGMCRTRTRRAGGNHRTRCCPGTIRPSANSMRR